jgi:hypothetical protein
MKNRQGSWLAFGAAVLGCAGISHAGAFSIYEIQSNTSDGDASVYSGQIHNVSGGIVTHIWRGFNDRVYLQDPGLTTWGAIVIKDGENGELADQVSVGDWISFDNIYIDEFGGTTFLQYRRSLAPDVTFAVESTGNDVPTPPVLTAADLSYPPNHSATEPYESMVISLEDVLVGARDLGRVGDNYELLQGGDLAWATDYMNVDAGGPYHARIVPGAELSRITGVVEQNAFSGWDYYQLNTRSAADIVPEPGTLLILAIGTALTVGRRRSQIGGLRGHPGECESGAW